MTFSKPQLRQALKQKRASFTKAELVQAEARINQYLIEYLSPNNPASTLLPTQRPHQRVIAVYWPLDGEPNCQPAYAAWRAAGHCLLLPVVEQKHAPLVFRQWQGEALTQRDAAGVLAPLQGRAMQPDTVLLPCLGFNSQGYRLGYGGGYYDRTAPLLPNAYWLGVAFSWQAVDFAADAHDVRLYQVITENGAIFSDT